jgi:two-component system chemotaxis sensor kinase CheA
MTSLSAKIREQIISSFRAELSEHLQTLNNGLLAIEQGTVQGDERTETIRSIFRAAHSLKGAARAVNVTIVEQMAHALESVLDALQKDVLKPSQEMFTATYQTIDAIQLVQEAYEKGETTPPFQATQAIFALEALLHKEPEAKDNEKNGHGNGKDKHAKKGDSAAHVEDCIKKTFASVREWKQEAEKPYEETPKVESKLNAESSAALPFEERRKAPDRRVSTDLETVRVKVSRLDMLMEYLNELLIIKIRSQQRLKQIKDIKERIGYLEKEWQSARGAYTHRAHIQGSENGKILSNDEKVILNYTGIAQEQVHNSNHEISVVERELASDISQMTLAIDELELEVKNLRMLPLSTITVPFARMVRDIALEHNKEVVLQVLGADTEMDKHILERVKDPLIHLLRNAVDHGIELPAERIALGKPGTGYITLEAEQVGRDVVIKVSDDGAGINMDRLRYIATKLGVDPSALSDTALQQFIFEAGISTSASVTDISGRGVGLDIVRKNMEELGGTCEVISEQGKGTTFTLTIPTRVTGSRGLMVRTSGQAFAIPINSVDYILSITQKNITLLEGHDVIYQNNQPVALLWLCNVLDLPRTASFAGNTELPVVILKNAEHRIAFVVDELAGEQEIVVKGLGDQLTRIAGLAGATILGTGEVVLILNAKDLIAMAMRGGYTNAMQVPVAAETEPMHPARRILVVDDSITTRTIEKNILEAAGYSVELATDGQEALNLVSAGSNPDIIIADVQMPRIDGLELVRRIRNNPQTLQIPIILVSSMSSVQDKQLGMEAGADAYIGKGGFDQSNLLETIEMIVTQKG